MPPSFENVIRNFCLYKALAEPEHLLKGGSVLVNEVAFCFIYDLHRMPQALTLCTVFGAAPLQNETAIYRALLSQNHVGHAGKGPGFCMSPKTGDVVHLRTMLLEEATPVRLASTMVFFSERAREWQTTFFLPQSATSRFLRTQQQQPGAASAIATSASATR
ncbi:hypothetical protein RCH09_002467 [Actimicrobium sp. GrIS 1.19]|uniref:CesT family type III secretion system chaperone n=1 Tax=Actimicrobium sp. GrIS 1.19 TaxID=3071708 RepID=UPI002DFD5453|nr:hypothetical protein [Actimicrobium sp. GrIS 1.19]